MELFENKMYFGDSKYIIKYNDNYENILFNWIVDVLEDDKEQNIFLDHEKIKETKELHKYILVTTKKILDQKIKLHDGFISTKHLQAMCSVAFILAVKFICSTDWENCYKRISYLAYLSLDSYTTEELVKMEADMFMTTDFVELHILKSVKTQEENEEDIIDFVRPLVFKKMESSFKTDS